jgi:hypothetical protein
LVFLVAEDLLLVIGGSGLGSSVRSILELFSSLWLSRKLDGKLSSSSLRESSREML